MDGHGFGVRIAVIIPIFEDREELQRQITSLPEVDELIVVDSSTENPVQKADLPVGGRLLQCAIANRAVQQNQGAAVAESEILIFLHADTQFGEAHVMAIREASEDQEILGGGFERYFDAPSRLLQCTCRLAAWRGRWLQWFLGDQVLFVRRSRFAGCGGFLELRVFEDYDLCRRLKRQGKLVCLQPPVLSSARRFAALGAWRRSFRDLLLTLVYCVRGTAPFERQ